jgi:hypothetical protein
MRNVKLRFCVLAVFGLGLVFTAASSCQAQDDNLFQYACAGDEMGVLFFPDPSPAIIKVYQNGTVILRQGDKFFAGKIETKELDKLKSKLQRQSFLKQSRFVETGDSDSGRGLCFFRYLDAGQEIIVAAKGRPQSGEWQSIVKLVEKYLPKSAELFYPEKIEFNLSKITSSGDACGAESKNKPNEWPFSLKLPLASGPNRVEVTDAEIIRYLFTDMYDNKLDWWWGFCENGDYYGLHLSTVPGWRHDELNLRIGSAASDLQSQWEERKKNK